MQKERKSFTYHVAGWYQRDSANMQLGTLQAGGQGQYVIPFMSYSIIHGCWFMAQGSWLMPQGSWLEAQGHEKLALNPPGQGPGAKLFIGH